MYLRTDIQSHCIIWFNLNTSPAVWMSLDARSIDQTRSQTNAPPEPDARYVVSSKQADGVFVMVDIRAETGSLENGGYRSGIYVSSVLKEVEAFFSEKRFICRPWPPENAFGSHRCCEKFGSSNGTLLVHCVFAACHNRMGRLMVLTSSCFIVFQPWISLSLSSVMGRIVLLRVYLEHRRSEVAIVSNQVSHRMWWDLSPLKFEYPPPN